MKVTSAILKIDDVTADVGHLYKVEKTAAAVILKIDDLTEDVDHLERAEKTTASNGDDVREEGSK